MTETVAKPGMGWVPDYPDFRDYDINKDEIYPQQKQKGQKQTIKQMLSSLKVAKAPGASLLPKHDLLTWCSPVEDQQALGS